MQKLMQALQRAFTCVRLASLATVRELRDVLRENGYASWSRYGSCAIVLCWCYVLVHTRQVPEHTDQAALLVAALYGANQFKQAVASYSQLKQAQAAVTPQAPTDQAQQ